MWIDRRVSYKTAKFPYWQCDHHHSYNHQNTGYYILTMCQTCFMCIILLFFTCIILLPTISEVSIAMRPWRWGLWGSETKEPVVHHMGSGEVVICPRPNHLWTSRKYDPISSLQRFNFQWYYPYFSFCLPFFYYAVAFSNYISKGWFKKRLKVVQSPHIIREGKVTQKCDLV